MEGMTEEQAQREVNRRNHLMLRTKERAEVLSNVQNVHIYGHAAPEYPESYYVLDHVIDLADPANKNWWLIEHIPQNTAAPKFQDDTKSRASRRRKRPTYEVR